MQIRHYGFLANRCRKVKLAQIRQWLGQVAEKQAADEPESAQAKHNDWPCSQCRQGQMRVRLVLSPVRLTGG